MWKKSILTAISALLFNFSIAQDTIVGLEYFFNTDPGPGNGIFFSVTPDDTVNISSSISVAGLAPGFHYMYIRALNNAGVWSVTDEHLFYIIDPASQVNTITFDDVIAAEFFYNTDPGIGNGIDLGVTPGDTVILNNSLPTTGLGPGFHYLYIRALSSDNTWSVVYEHLFYIYDEETGPDITFTDIVELEYFFNTDPGPGNGIQLPITPDDTVHVVTSIPTTGLAHGFHDMYLRAKTSDNVWSVIDRRLVFIIDDSLASPPITYDQNTEVEYFINNDPGLGNGIDIPVANGDTLNVITNISTTGFNPGFHNLVVRSKTNKELWSVIEERPFYIFAPPPAPVTQITEIEYFFDVDPGVGLATKLPVSGPFNDLAIINQSILMPCLSPGQHFIYIRAKNDLGVWSVIDVDTVNVAPGMLASPVNVAGPDTVCFPAKVEMFADSAQGISYQWLYNGVPIAGANYAYYSADTSGNYSLQQSCLGDTVVSNIVIAIINYEPEITFCTLDTSVNNDAGVCEAIVNYPAAIAIGSSPPPVITYSQASGTSFPVGSTTVYVVATNDCGVDSCSFTVTVNDDENPTVTCPADISQTADAGDCGAIVNFAATATDNCGIASITYSQNSGTFFPVGSTTVTVTATDIHGNSSTCSFDVVITDDEDPIVTCPADISQTADAGDCGAIVNFAATATDNCGIASITYSQNSGTFFPVGTTTVTVTATDIHGNSSTCSFDVVITDDEDPIVTCPANISQTADAGTCGAIVNFAATATDNCGVASITYSQDSGTFFPVGSTTVTVTATDIHGNSSVCSFDVVITDNENPVVTCPANISQTADAGNCGAIVNFAATATDNCGVPSITYSQDPGTFFPVGITTVTVTATDIHGNSSQCSFGVTVTDDENPVVTCSANISQTADAGDCGAIVNFAATATDNCGVASITYSQDSGTFFPVGSTTVTVTATDIHGNSSQCSFGVTVADDENPVVTCSANIIQTADAGDCGAIVNFAAIATDNCGVASITYSQNSGTFFPMGTTTVTVTATDIHGNSSVCSFDVTVTDDENPTVNCPANILQTADAGDCGAIVNFIATATDNCAVDTIVYSQAPGTFFPVGTTTVTVTATDIHGNSSTCSFDVVITDDKDPIVTCPANISQTADAGNCGAIVNFAATATDNCGVASITYSQDSGTFFPVGTTTVTVTATDIHGNSSTCSFDVTVTDDEIPVVNCPSNISQTADAGDCGAIVTFVATATDNCGVSSITYSQDPGTFFPVGTTTVTVTATDIHGNSSQCSFDVTVTDDENPIVTCPANISQTADAGDCGAIVNFTATATDNCGVSSITYSQDPGTFFPVGTTTVTVTATDIHGNSSQCSFDVTITDDEIPVVNCPSNISQTADVGDCGAIVNFVAIATDNCAVDTIVYSQDPGTLFAVGTTTVIVTATDIHGNSSQCSFDVIITDDENATVNCSASIITDSDSGQCNAVVNYSVTTSDNCPGETIIQTTGLSSGSAFPIGVTVNTFIVTDGAVNTDSCSFTVTVQDNEIPEIICPPTASLQTDSGSTTASGSVGTPVVNDNCGIDTVYLSDTGPYPVGTTTVTWTVVDLSGNSATCSQDVVVTTGCNPPVLTCPADFNLPTDPGQCGAVVTYAVTVTGTSPIISYSHPSGTLFPVGTTTVTVIATNSCGSDTCSLNITVNDTEPPKVFCPTDIVVNNDTGLCSAIVNYVISYSDNCGGDTLLQISGLSSGSVFPLGVTLNQFVAIDAAGNSDTCQFTVTVIDAEPPTIACSSGDTLIADSSGFSNGTLTPPTTSDNCAVDTVFVSDASPYPIGTTTVTWTAIDIAGNSATCIQDVIVTSSCDPALVSCPADTTVVSDPGQCGAMATYAGTVTGTSPTISYSHPSGTLFPVGTTTVTVIATNSCGSDTCSFYVTVNDTEPPVVNCPANITQTADAGDCGAIVTFAATATDNCGVSSITYSQDPGTFFPVGTTTVTVTATDIHGNSSQCSFDVTVTDDENPIVTCPANISQTADAGDCGAIVNFTATATDNCGVSSITYSQDPGTFFSVGTTTVTVTATDIHGNSSQCSFDVTVTDDENPVVTCPANISQTADAGDCGAIVTFVATAIDNCGIASITYSQDPGTFFPVGTTTVIVTATDIHGNSSTCSFDVTVTDDEIPVVTCPANISQTADAGDCGAIVTFAATATGNCGVASITYSQNSGTFFPVGTTTVTVTATDINGNYSTCSFDVVITDDENPVINCPADIIICAGEDVILQNPVATDNCGILNITSITPVSYLVGANEVVWIATDVNGNTSSCTQNVMVNALPDPSAIATDPIVCEGATTDVTVTAIGGASPYTGTGIFNLASGEHTFIVTDSNGCSDSTSIIIAENFLNLAVANSVLYNGEMISCYGASDAAVEISPVSFINPGGVSSGPFEYSMNSVSFQSSNIFNGLSAGNYTFEVKDLSTGCIKSVPFLITQPDQLTATTTVFSNIGCGGSIYGSAEVNATGGTGPYNYSWLTPVPKQTQVNNEIPSGTWTVIVTDVNGCSVTASVTITQTQTSSISVSLGPDEVGLYGALGYNGCVTLIADVTGGAGTAFSWTSNDPLFTPVTTTGSSITVCNQTDTTFTYIVVVTDVYGCTASDTINVLFANINCSNNQNNTKVKVCNINPSDPSKCKTICVSASAVPALLANGSYLGKCLPNCIQTELKLINNPDEFSDLTVYPNPTNHMVTVSFISSVNMVDKLIIKDFTGRVLLSLNVDNEENFERELNLSEFEDGIYLLSVYEKDLIIKSKILIKAE